MDKPWSKHCSKCGNFIGQSKHICKSSPFKSKKHSAKAKKRISEYRKKYYKNNPHPKGMKDKKHSEEAKRKIGNNHPDQKKENNPSWLGGVIKSWGGYLKVLMPEHPFCQKSGYILQHRLVMEAHLGRYLSKTEGVHHKNGIKNDNRLENLILFVNNKNWHTKTCPRCDFKFIVK